jgi:hypothetical protein
MKWLKRRSTLTGIANALFACGLVVLFATLFTDADAARADFKTKVAIALGLFGATVMSWFAAAYRGPEMY